MIPAALHEPPTRKTFQTVKCICDEVARNAADFGTAWPIFAYYFDAARIPTYDYSTPASVFRANCVEQCIVAVSFPSKEEPNMPRLFEREDYRALLASRALDIFAWAKHMAQPFVMNPDRVTWHAYQALSRVFDLLQDIRFCVPDAVDTILAFWKAELRSQQLFDMSHATMFSPTSWAMLELLGRIGNPGPQHYPQLPPLRERFMGNMNTIVATAFARVDRLNHSLEAAKSDALRTLGPSILETLTRVAGFVDLTCLVCPRAIRIVTAEYRHFTARPIETSGIFAAPDFEKFAQSASRMAAVAAVDYLKFALSTRPVTIALQSAIPEGFLDALWCSSKRLNEQTEVGAQLSTRTDIPLPVLQFFIEEVILAHMWDRSVFVSILHWVRNNQALTGLEVDQRVQDRLLEWAMLAPERDEIASLDHCDYSKVSKAWHHQLHVISRRSNPSMIVRTPDTGNPLQALRWVQRNVVLFDFLSKSGMEDDRR
jgi:hypothetical protein